MTPPPILEPRPVHEVWDNVKPLLEEMRETWPELGTWRTEDVYAALFYGDAIIYTVDEGFIVCTYEVDPYTKDKDLFIWIAYAYPKARGGMLAKYLPSLIEMAKAYGCKGVSTASNHPALAKSRLLTPVYTQYRVAINESTETGSDSAGD